MKLIIVNSAEAFLGEAKVSKEKVEIIGIRIDNVYPTKRDVNEFVQAENKPNEIKTFIYQPSEPIRFRAGQGAGGSQHHHG